jgi:hypothetical protein
MQKLTQYIVVIAFLFTSFTVQAQTAHTTVNIAEENVAFEVLYNSAKNSGSIIFKVKNCSACQQKTLTYANPASVSINGYDTEQQKLNKSFSGFGDISYNTNTLTLDHLNIYQQ